MAPYVKPEFEPTDLVNLDKFQAVVKMHHRAQTQPAFSLTFEQLREPTDADKREQRIRELSIKNYTPKNREEVLNWLSKRYPKQRRNRPVIVDRSPDEFDTSLIE